MCHSHNILGYFTTRAPQHLLICQQMSTMLALQPSWPPWAGKATCGKLLTKKTSIVLCNDDMCCSEINIDTLISKYFDSSSLLLKSRGETSRERQRAASQLTISRPVSTRCHDTKGEKISLLIMKTLTWDMIQLGLVEGEGFCKQKEFV